MTNIRWALFNKTFYWKSGKCGLTFKCIVGVIVLVMGHIVVRGAGNDTYNGF